MIATLRQMRKGILRVGLIGCGEVCEHKHMPALRQIDGAQVTAVADVNERRARHVASRFGIDHVFADPSSLIRSGAADVIGVLVPPAAHVEVASMAIEAGCHVLIEKPIALTIVDADALVDLADRHDLRILMGLHMRWHRLIRRAREYVQSGALGDVESIQTIWNSPRPDRGIPDWKRRRVDGGGSLVEIGVHLFDLWRYVLNTEVEEIFALSRHGTRDDENATVTAVLTNGVLASAHLSERTAHDIQLEVCGSEGRLRVSCQRFDGFETYARHETGGSLKPRLREMERFLREFPRGIAHMRRLGDYGNSYTGAWTHLLDTIRTPQPVECTVEDGREALRVVLAAAASATAGRPVRLAEAPSTLTPAARSEGVLPCV
jgi:myo-inositol 2-dehydrogenase/D-chiro-inositol 1-dehydrogenase